MASQFYGTPRRSRRSPLRRTQQVICSQFAPTPPQNTLKRDQPSDTIAHHLTGERLDRFRVIACEIRGLSFCGLHALITQRSLVQIQPPQPCNVAKPKGPSDSAPLVLFDGL